jgi:DNA-binding beta-propeller fold protein YncE
MNRTMSVNAVLVGMLACAYGAAHAATSTPPALTPEPSIELPGVTGRIDHLAIDLEHRYMFVAELGNGSVDVIDLNTQRSIQRIERLNEPQGLAYSTRTHTLFVATGGDGVLHTFSGSPLTPGSTVVIGRDADNVRIDDGAARAYVAFDGGIAVLNATTLEIIARVRLKAHPESFQLQPSERRMFVNVPDAGEIAVIDLTSRKQIDSWKTGTLSANFALALNASSETVITAFRRPPKLAFYTVTGGRFLDALPLCSDSDDIFVDAKRARVYASCGEGVEEVFDLHTRARTNRIVTRVGARTSLYVPEWDRLFVAARATAEQPAALLIYRVTD